MTTAARPVVPAIDPVEIITATPETMSWHIAIGWDFAPLWPSQRLLLDALRTERRILFLKSRQLRFTWTLALWVLHRLIDRPAISGAYVSIGQRESEDVTRRIVALHTGLPDDVRRRYPLVSESLSRLAIGHPEGESELLSLPSSSNAGRGKTLDFLVGDERPKWPHPEEQEASLLPAAANGIVVMGGTANGFDSFRERWESADELGWHRLFAGALSDPTRTIEWVMRERRAVGDLGPQEYPLTAAEAFLSSGRCIFDQGSLQDLLENFTAPPRGRYDLRADAGVVVADPALEGRWQVWEWPKAGRKYVIAADVCGGGGGSDYAYATVHDAASWDQVACLHGRPDPGVLADEMAKAGWLYRADNGPALLVPEANNHGQAVVALLSEWAYPRIYVRETFDRRGSAPAPSSMLGWLTTGKSRDLALSALQDAIRDQEAGIRDKAAIGECLAFVDKDGRTEAVEGAHDDRVIALSIAYAVLSRTRAGRKVEPVTIPTPYVPRVSAITGYWRSGSTRRPEHTASTTSRGVAQWQPIPPRRPRRSSSSRTRACPSATTATAPRCRRSPPTPRRSASRSPRSARTATTSWSSRAPPTVCARWSGRRRTTARATRRSSRRPRPSRPPTVPSRTRTASSREHRPSHLDADQAPQHRRLRLRGGAREGAGELAGEAPKPRPLALALRAGPRPRDRRDARADGGAHHRAGALHRWLTSTSPGAPRIAGSTSSRSALLHAGNRRTSMMRRLEYLEERVDALQRRVADAEDRAESLRQDRVESLRRVARYTAAPANYPPGYPYPFGGTTDEED